MHDWSATRSRNGQRFHYVVAADDHVGSNPWVLIEDLDVSDAGARSRWHAALTRAAEDRPHALVPSLDACEVSMTEPNPYWDRVWLQAVEDDEHVVGVAEVDMPLAENLDLAWCEVSVVASRRRRGIGRALWEAAVHRARAAGRARVGGEVSLDVAVPGAGLAFARAVGAQEKHREDHLVADLPLRSTHPPRVHDAYRVVSWRGRCPDEHREAYLAMRNQMNADVPVGDLDLDAEVLDDARLAVSETRLARSYDVRVAAAQRVADGVFGGYSLLFVPHGADHAWQDDTLVMPGHRGHRLGAALKVANYADLPPSIGVVHTWTAPSNTAMHRTNTSLGFRVVEHMYEVEAPIGCVAEGR